MAIRARRTYPNLRAYFEDSGDTQQRFAQRFGRDQSWVSRVVNGLQEPSLAEAMEISRVARIPLESLITRPLAVADSK